MDAEVELKADRFAGGVAAQSALDGLPGGGEDSQNAVADELSLDRRAGALADDAPQCRIELAGLGPKRCVAELLRKRGGLRDVREQDDGGAFRQLRLRFGLLALAQEFVDGVEQRLHVPNRRKS